MHYYKRKLYFKFEKRNFTQRFPWFIFNLLEYKAINQIIHYVL